MRPQTRLQFNKVLAAVRQYNHVDNPEKKFAIAPELVQRLVERTQESSAFLKHINLVSVSAQQGQKLGLGVGSPVASRTDTNTKEREPSYVGVLDADDYACVQTNFDTFISYAVMDSWSHLAEGEFRTRYTNAFIKRIALDRLMIGWNGVEAAKETDRATYPLLQDVNIGWLEKIRRYAPAHLMGYSSDGEASTDTFRLGEGGHYQTLDALVFDIVSNLIDPWHQESGDLVLILGRELWVNHGLTLYNENRPATERLALETWFAREAVAGLPTITVPFFPTRGLLVTSYDNLSLYSQEGSTRRAIIDNPKRDRVEEFLSSNDAYVVEDYGKFAGVRPTAIQLKDANGNWA